MNPAVDALISECTRAARGGAGFPTIWDSILKSHSLVESTPIKTFEDEEERPHLEVRLRNGYWLRYCTRSNDFSLRRARLHRSF